MMIKKSIIFFTISILFCACSLKLENRYLNDKVIQYDDEIEGIRIKIKKQGSICLQKAILETREIYLLLKLDKNCNVLSGKYYNIYKEYVKDFPNEQRKSLSLKIKKYLKQRESVNTQISKNNTINQ